MIAVIGVVATLALSAAQAFPSESLYQLDVPLEAHDGKKAKLADFAGKPVVFAMFYATCPRACPLLISDVKSVVAKLDEQERKGLRVVLVSLDPERDTPFVLQGVVESRGLQGWTLLRASAADTRALATAVGVRYRDVGTAGGADGPIEHSSKIVLLDWRGVPVADREAQSSTDELVKAIRAQVAQRTGR